MIPDPALRMIRSFNRKHAVAAPSVSTSTLPTVSTSKLPIYSRLGLAKERSATEEWISRYGTSKQSQSLPCLDMISCAAHFLSITMVFLQNWKIGENGKVS